MSVNGNSEVTGSPGNAETSGRACRDDTSEKRACDALDQHEKNEKLKFAAFDGNVEKATLLLSEGASFQHHDENGFWIDSNNSLLKLDKPELSIVGEAYDKPWHLEKYKP